MSKHIVSLTGILTIGVLLFTGGCKNEEHKTVLPPELPSVEVQTDKAVLQPVTNQIELLGTIESVNKVEIAAKVSGTISELPVVLGSKVNKGDLLIRVRAGEIDARVSQSMAELEKAKRNLEREKKPLSKKAATKETVRSLQETVNIAEAAYKEALTYQTYTTITAPIDGHITRKHVNMGDLATPGKPLLNIEDNSRLQVITEIPERYILQIHKGDTLNVAVPAAQLSIIGTVSEVAPTTSPKTRTAPVKLDIVPHAKLHGGQFVRVTLGRDDDNTLTVPKTAVSTFGQIDRVFVITDNRAELRLVKTGRAYGDSIEILAGLSVGETVVSSDSQTLKDGQPVTIR